jgi:hypothetical protein
MKRCRFGLVVDGINRAPGDARNRSGYTAAPLDHDVVAATGTVVSSLPHTLSVRSANGVYVVYVFDKYTKKPATISQGAMVTVLSTPSGEPGIRLATDVLFYTPPPPGQATETAAPKQSAESSTSSASRSAHPYETGEAVPVNVRKLESDIAKQSKRFAFGFRGGVGLDPEVMLIGVQAKMGSFFNRSFSLRPNLDFGFGEVTKMFALDLNGVFRLPINPRHSRWSMFAGVGPALNLIHRNFEEAAEGGDIDFGDFKFQSGLNILTGVEMRNGFFIEGKATIWTGPHLRFTFGYHF